MNDSGFNMEFEHGEISYLAFVHHIEELSPEQREKYNIRENSFFVHLFTSSGFKTFEMFIGIDSMEWETNASSIIIDPEIVKIIGDRIEAMNM